MGDRPRLGRRLCARNADRTVVKRRLSVESLEGRRLLSNAIFTPLPIAALVRPPTPLEARPAVPPHGDHVGTLERAVLTGSEHALKKPPSRTWYRQG
jgi:hypothetical protein